MGIRNWNGSALFERPFLLAMVAYLVAKLWTTAGLWALTIFSTYIPFIIQRHGKKSSSKLVMSFCNCLAGGVVLGTMLLHVLPTLFQSDAVSSEDSSTSPLGEGTIKYPLGCLFAGLSFLWLFAIDRLYLSKNHPHHAHNEIILDLPVMSTLPSSSKDSSFLGTMDKDLLHVPNCGTDKSQDYTVQKTQAFVFVMALSLHSFLEGLGLASVKNETELYSFIISLFSHKWLEAFALGFTVMQARFTPCTTFILNFFYSTLTPIGTPCSILDSPISHLLLGILGGICLLHMTSSSYWHLILSTIFNGLSVGSFLFICCVEMVPAEFLVLDKYSGARFATLLSGFLIMAAMALLD